MHRFFVAPELVKQGTTTLILPHQLAHQVRDVLHLAIDEKLILLDNSGDEVLCNISASSRKEVQVEIRERNPGKPEPSIHITLCQGLLKSARFELVLEKGTELGVSTFVPTLCHRSMAGLEDAGPSKLQRWQRIIQEAAEQCERTLLPELQPIRPLAHALNAIPEDALALMPWEEAQGQSLKDALQATAEQPRTSHIVIFIGPEGGLEEEEVKLARQHSVQIITLGARILRAETAALATIASILYALE